MKSGRKTSVLFAAGLLAAASLSAADNPYRTISDKNVFRLVEPPPPPKPPEVKPPEAPTNVKFMGMSGVGSEITAWFAIEKKDPKNPAAPITPTYVSLLPGQRDSGEGTGGLELVQLNDSDGSAKILYNREERTVYIQQAPKTGGAPMPGQPMIPTFGGTYISPGSGGGALANPVNVQPASMQMGNPIPQPAANPGGGVPPPTLPVTPLQAVPVRAIRSGALANPAPGPTASAAPMSYEQSVVQMEVLRQLTKDQVNKGTMPPLPPTPLSPGGQ